MQEIFALYDPNYAMMSLDEGYIDLTDFLTNYNPVDSPGFDGEENPVDSHGFEGEEGANGSADEIVSTPVCSSSKHLITAGFSTYIFVM